MVNVSIISVIFFELLDELDGRRLTVENIQVTQ